MTAAGAAPPNQAEASSRQSEVIGQASLTSLTKRRPSIAWTPRYRRISAPPAKAGLHLHLNAGVTATLQSERAAHASPQAGRSDGRGSITNISPRRNAAATSR